MCSATVSRLPAAEPRDTRHTSAGVVGYPAKLGRVTVATGPDPIKLAIGRAIIGMTAEEAESIAMALAKAAADSRRVQL